MPHNWQRLISILRLPPTEQSHRCHPDESSINQPYQARRPSISPGMLIDGQKWACEACIRGHRVSSCKHHGIYPSLSILLCKMNDQLTPPDRPLIRIKRKGRPFATCTICHSTPCEAPSEHTRLKRESELKVPSAKVTPSQHTTPTGRQADLPFDREESRRHADGTMLIWFHSCSLEIFPAQTLSAASPPARVPPHRTAAVR